MEINVDMKSRAGAFNCNIEWGGNAQFDIYRLAQGEDSEYVLPYSFYTENVYLPKYDAYKEQTYHTHRVPSEGSLHIHGNNLQSKSIVFPRLIAHPYLMGSNALPADFVTHLAYPEVTRMRVSLQSKYTFVDYLTYGPNSLAHFYDKTGKANCFINFERFKPIWNSQFRFWDQQTIGGQTYLFEATKRDWWEESNGQKQTPPPFYEVTLPSPHYVSSIDDPLDLEDIRWLYDVSYMFANRNGYSQASHGYTHNVNIQGFIGNATGMFYNSSLNYFAPSQIWFEDLTYNATYDGDVQPILLKTDYMFSHTQTFDETIFPNLSYLPIRMWSAVEMFCNSYVYSSTLSEMKIPTGILQNTRGMFKSAFRFNTPINYQGSGAIDDTSYMFYWTRNYNVQMNFIPGGSNNAAYMYSRMTNKPFKTDIVLQGDGYAAPRENYYPYNAAGMFQDTNLTGLNIYINGAFCTQYDPNANCANMFNNVGAIGNIYVDNSFNTALTEYIFAASSITGDHIHFNDNVFNCNETYGMTDLIFGVGSYQKGTKTSITVNNFYVGPNCMRYARHIFYQNVNAWINQMIFDDGSLNYKASSFVQGGSYGYSCTWNINYIYFMGNHGNLSAFAANAHRLNVPNGLYINGGTDFGGGQLGAAFSNCRGLICNDLFSVNIHNEVNAQNMFRDCVNLRPVDGSANIFGNNVQSAFRGAGYAAGTGNLTVTFGPSVGDASNIFTSANFEHLIINGLNGDGISAKNLREAFRYTKGLGNFDKMVFTERVGDLYNAFDNSDVKTVNEIWIWNSAAYYVGAFMSLDSIGTLYTKSSGLGAVQVPHKSIPYNTNIIVPDAETCRQVAYREYDTVHQNYMGLGDCVKVAGSGNWTGRVWNEESQDWDEWDEYSDNYSVAGTPNGQGSIAWDNLHWYLANRLGGPEWYDVRVNAEVF